MTAGTKRVGQAALLTMMYVLLYLGANDGLWPLFAHFHHHDWQIPALVNGAISSVILPLLVAYLLAAIQRRGGLVSFPWVLIFAPSALLLFAKYAADALYPPFWTEASSLLLVGGIQGVSAVAGWFLYRMVARDSATRGD
jgi:hypothetical protein